MAGMMLTYDDDPPSYANNGPAANYSSNGADLNRWVFHPTDIHKSAVPDSKLFPVKYEYTVTGRRRKKASKLDNRPALGARVTLNGTNVAIFRYGIRYYAIKDECPHMGRSLHLGDIEDVSGELCISCPAHHWSFSLATGICASPAGARTTEVYRVRVDRRTGLLSVGFNFLGNSVFNDDNF